MKAVLLANLTLPATVRTDDKHSGRNTRQALKATSASLSCLWVRDYLLFYDAKNLTLSFLSYLRSRGTDDTYIFTHICPMQRISAFTWRPERSFNKSLKGQRHTVPPATS